MADTRELARRLAEARTVLEEVAHLRIDEGQCLHCGGLVGTNEEGVKGEYHRPDCAILKVRAFLAERSS